MNTTNYKQYDTRWSGLPYKDLPDNIGNNGCGMVAINNGIIEMLSQIDQTPITMQPHCRQYACHDGTYWSAIPKMLEFYGCTEVMEHDNMSSLWRELEKGDRIAIYMMNKYPGGSKGIHWTSGGHFIVSCAFRYENGLHKLYVKDSNSTSSDRNYWISYEENMRGDVSACWSGKLNGSPSPTPTPTPPGKIAVDGVGGYETVYRLQQFLNLSDPDGLIGRQRSSRKKYYPALTAVSFSLFGSSNTVTALQKFLNLSDPDGIIGPNTAGALQRRLRDLGYLAASEEIDNIIGAKTMRALQTALNNDFKKVTPPTPPTPTPGGDTKMIDVSEFQGDIDWNKVKADGIKAVIIRVGGRGGEKGNIYDDDHFFENMKGAYNAGLSIGIYFLTQAISAAEGKEEAEYTIRKWTESGIPISYPICIDSEDVEWTNEDGSKGYGRAHSTRLSQARRTQAIKAFAEECKRQGFASMIYASTNWLYNQVDMNVLGPIMDVWVAQWSSSCDYRGKYIIWQYSSTGSVNGIRGNVDMDKCYVDPKKVDPPKPGPTPTPDPKPYSGPFPTEAEIKAASNTGIHNNIVSWCKEIADGGKYHYVQFTDDEYTHKCPICTGRTYDLGWNCIGYAFASWRHGGGIPCTCNCGVIYNGLGDNYYYMSNAEVLQSMKNRIGVSDIQLIRNDNNMIPQDSLIKGDLLMYYNPDHTYQHMATYIGNGKISDDSSGQRPNIKYGKSYEYSSATKCLFAIRYTGTRSYIKKGDEGAAVLKWQDFLNWWSDGAFYKECGPGDTYFGNNTHKWTVKFQEEVMGKGQGDGTVGPKTISAAQSIRK